MNKHQIIRYLSVFLLITLVFNINEIENLFKFHSLYSQSKLQCIEEDEPSVIFEFDQCQASNDHSFSWVMDHQHEVVKNVNTFVKQEKRKVIHLKNNSFVFEKNE